MLAHRTHVACARGGRSLKFWTSIDEPVDCALERWFIGCPVNDTRPRPELVAGGATMRHDERNSTGAGLRGDHAESLCLATVYQGVRARQQARKFIPITKPGKYDRSRNSFCQQLQLLPF